MVRWHEPTYAAPGTAVPRPSDVVPELADMLSAAGADRVISVDLHSGQIQGFFDTPFDHLVAAPVLEAYMREHFGPEVAQEHGAVRSGEDPRKIENANVIQRSRHEGLLRIIFG